MTDTNPPHAPAHAPPHARGHAAVLAGIGHRYAGEQEASLQAVDLTLPAGERLAVIGSSGAGKSTLLALLGGQLENWWGTAVVLGHAIRSDAPPPRELRPEIGFIYQEFALVERATVRQNVMNGRLGRTSRLASILGRFSKADHQAVERALADTAMTEFAEKRVDRLSGGQRQRVAIARCLAQEPKLIIADEPVSNLDPVRAERILELVSDLAKARGVTLVFSSHQPDLALRFADRVLAFKDGEVDYLGPPAGLDRNRLAEIYDGEGEARRSRLRLVG